MKIKRLILAKETLFSLTEDQSAKLAGGTGDTGVCQEDSENVCSFVICETNACGWDTGACGTGYECGTTNATCACIYEDSYWCATGGCSGGGNSWQFPFGCAYDDYYWG